VPFKGKLSFVPTFALTAFLCGGVSAQEGNLAELTKAGQEAFLAGRYSDAERLLNKALTQAETDFLPEVQLARILSDVCITYLRQGRAEIALTTCRRAVEIQKTEKLPAVYAASLNNLAEVYRFMGHSRDAEKLYRSALDIYQSRFGKQDLRATEVLGNLALAYSDLGDNAHSEAALRECVATLEKARPHATRELSNALDQLGTLLRIERRYGPALPLLERGLALRVQALGPEHPLVAESLNHLGTLWYGRGRPQKALPLFERALSIDEKVFGGNSTRLCASLVNLAGASRTQRQYARAEALCQRAIGILQQAPWKDPVTVKAVLEQYEPVLIKTRGRSEAAALLAKTRLTLFPKNPDPQN